jgi:hypothetical protein
MDVYEANDCAAVRDLRALEASLIGWATAVTAAAREDHGREAARLRLVLIERLLRAAG